ncbi:MAG: hypothetical protein WB643_11145, partial [Candidatus Bathyarchaeia archaeon]
TISNRALIAILMLLFMLHLLDERTFKTYTRSLTPKKRRRPARKRSLPRKRARKPSRRRR